MSETETEEIYFEMFISEEIKLQGQAHTLEIDKEISLPNVNIGFVGRRKPENPWVWNLGSPPNKFMVTKFSKTIGDIVEGNIDIKLACPMEDCGWIKGNFSCIVENEE